MFGYVYKITHIPSGKFYIGQHKATEFDENYWGSGRIIKDYIKTCGKKFVWHKKKERRFWSRDCHYKSRRNKNA